MKRQSNARPRTLRGNVRPTPATMHLEMTMLLHQEQRLRSELEILRQRSLTLESMIEAARQRIWLLRDLCDSIDAADPPPGSGKRAGVANRAGYQEQALESNEPQAACHQPMSIEY